WRPQRLIPVKALLSRANISDNLTCPQRSSLLIWLISIISGEKMCRQWDLRRSYPVITSLNEMLYGHIIRTRDRIQGAFEGSAMVWAKQDSAIPDSSGAS